jgi:hypothetical protein
MDADRPGVAIDAETMQVLPDSAIMKADSVSCVEGQIIASVRSVSSTLAREAVLRELRDADLSSPDGVTHLVGLIGLELETSVDLRHLGLVDTICSAHDEVVRSPTMIEGFYDEARSLETVASWGGVVRLIDSTVTHSQDNVSFDCTIHCGDWRRIAQRFRLVRAAVNHYVAHQEGRDVHEAWVAEGFESHLSRVFLDSSVIRGRDELDELDGSPETNAWRTFVAVHAYVLREHVPNLTTWLVRQRSRLRIAPMPHNVSSALMVQLHNLIVDGLEIRRCANETCGRPFVRQRGRATRGQYRTRGVMYCDASCANSQVQREFRRRARQRAAAMPLEPLVLPDPG